MIIRLSDYDDFKQIIELWNEAFGDSENEIKFFLDNKYIPENTLVIEENGRIVSMLFLLEGKMRISSCAYPSYYLYAACTAKDFRGRGYMADLLKKANEIGHSRKKDFICLMPGEKSLFDFYEKHGYKTVFNKKILTINRKEFECFRIIEDYKKCDLEYLRNNAFSSFDFFEWDNDSIEFALNHNELYSGTSIKSCKGYFLYNQNNETFAVKEFAFTEQNFEYGVNLLLTSCDSEIIIINLPSQYKTVIGEYKIVPSAMICPVSECAKSVADSLKNAYLGLTLD